MGRKDYIYVYLAGPMESCTDEEAHAWRNYVMTNLKKTAIQKTPTGAEIIIPKNVFYFLNPMTRDYRHLNDDHAGIRAVQNEIVELDLRDVDKADVLFVNAFKKSAGTSMEIKYAHDHDKIVVTVVPKDKPLSAWVSYHSTKICYTLDEAIEWIAQNVRS